jgi:thiamine pyrophosphokinase
MKRAIIFFNGDLSDLSQFKNYRKDNDYIICADGGAAHVAKLGLTPDVIIGDFDSLSPSMQRKFAKQKIEQVKFPNDKNETDSELAIQYAIEKGYTNILVFGLLGSRLDHLLTNILALSLLKPLEANVKMIEGNQEIQLIRDFITLKGNAGDLVSLIPIQKDAEGIITKNLQYPLNDETLYVGYSRGMSNVMTQKIATISLKKGLLLIIHSFL